MNPKRSGSRFIKVHQSVLSSPKHRKGYLAKQGRFSMRVLQSLAGRNWRTWENPWKPKRKTGGDR